MFGIYPVDKNMPTLKRAKRLSSFLQIPLLSKIDSNIEVVLMVKQERIFLNFLRYDFDFKWDFSSSNIFFRGRKHKPPLIKAIGGKNLTVFDITAGFGKDSWLLSFFGNRVIAIEKNKIAYVMLIDALSRALNISKEITLRIRPICMDSFTILKNFTILSQKMLLPFPDVIYIDPFLPPKSMKKRLPKKYIQSLRIIGQTDNNEVELLTNSLKIAKKRVVFKRSSRFSKPVLEPSFRIEAKSVIFDVYLTKNVF